MIFSTFDINEKKEKREERMTEMESLKKLAIKKYLHIIGRETGSNLSGLEWKFSNCSRIPFPFPSSRAQVFRQFEDCLELEKRLHNATRSEEE